METRTKYTVTSPAPDQSAKLLRLPADLHEWFKAEAKRQDRSTNAEMVRALRAYRAANNLTLTRPQKYDTKRWIVRIVKGGLLTGVAAPGDTPEEATKNAQEKIDRGEGELE